MTNMKNILIVEDEKLTQRYITNILKQNKSNIIECSDNANDALKAFRSKHYDLILMDINIKGSMDGLQLSREILRHKEVPIIFITAHNDEDTMHEALEISPCGFIPKPFSIRDLEIVVDSLDRDSKKELISSIETIKINEEYTYKKGLNKIYYLSEEVKLTAKQQKLIEVLCDNIDTIVPLTVLKKELWGNTPIVVSALRTLVYSIRKLLPSIIIISHSKVGYILKQKKQN